MIKKYLPAIFFSIIFVLLLVFLNNRSSLNFVENTPTLTAVVPTKAVETKWQTYRNEKYGFEFQYPTNFLVTDNGDKINFSSQDLSSENQDYIQISIINKFTVNKYISTLSKGDAVNIKQDNIIQNQVKFVKLTYTNTMADVVEYLIEKNSDVLVFNSSINILSTFKFLPNVKTLLSYKNKTLGYQFQYPDDWQLDDSDIADKRTEITNGNGKIVIDVIDNLNFTNWTYDRYFNYLKSGGASEGQIFEPSLGQIIVPTTVSGQKAYIAETGCCGGAQHNIFVFHQGKLYSIYLSAPAGQLSTNLTTYSQVFNKIVSTFKFIN